MVFDGRGKRYPDIRQTEQVKEEHKYIRDEYMAVTIVSVVT